MAFEEKNNSIILKELLGYIVSLVIQVSFFVLCIIFIPKLILFFMPLIFGYFVSLVSNNLCSRIEKKYKISRSKIALFIIILVTVVIVLFVYLIAYFIYINARNFTEDVSMFIKYINSLVQDFEMTINQLFVKLPIELNLTEIKIPLLTPDNFINIFNNLSSSIVKIFLSFAKYVPIFFINLIFAIIFAYVLIIYNNSIKILFEKIFSKKVKQYYNFVKCQIKIIFSGWLRSQIIVLFLVFIVLTIAFIVIKVKYYIFISLFIAFIDALPIFGSGLFLWPWMVICVIKGEYVNFVVLLIAYIIIQFIRNVIQNKIMSVELSLNPFATIFILFLGFKLYGFAGFIFSLPIGMFILSLYKFGTFDNLLWTIKKILSLTKNLIMKREE